MSAKNCSRFDIDAVRALAGDKVFARGEAYHRAGQVEILSLEPGRVLAQVAGTEDYRTILTGSDTRIDGECSCPAFEDWGFCKHMVAAALAVNAMDTDGEARGIGALARIREHLKGRGVDALVEMIIGVAERDPALFRRLDMASVSVHADEKTLERRLRKAIDGAVRTRGYVEYREVPGWAEGVESALDAVADLAPDGRADLARRLTEHAIDRIENAIGEIDDSDGHCGALLHRARDIHLAACRAAKPDPVALARDLFAREMEEDYDTFYGAAALYADVLGEDGLAEYRSLAAEAWEKLPSRIGGDRARHDFSGDYSRLEGMLDFFAEREGDVETRITLRAKDLSSPWKYLQLAEFCLAESRQEEALRRAEEGLWLFEDEGPDERLVFFTVDLLSEAGRKQDAEAHLWRAFERTPSLEIYQRLRKLGGRPAHERAALFLKEWMSKGAPTSRYSPADLLIRVLMEDGMFDAAWTTVREHGSSVRLKKSLAQASEATHPGEALKVYAERVDELVEAGGNPAYAEAAELVARMAALRAPAEQTAYVTEIKARFRRKRNFMKLLG